jgi:hypothetical protein
MGMDRVTGVVSIALSLSDDGENWGAPIALADRNGRVYTPLDEGWGYANPATRYKAVMRVSAGYGPQWQPELWVSPDGVNWTLARSPISINPYGESYTLYRNDASYGLLLRHNKLMTWVDLEGHTHVNTKLQPFVRTYAYMLAPTADSFANPVSIAVPGNQDSGETQFYSTSNVLRRGNMRIAALNVYREDLVASGAPAGSLGTGYASLVWSEDGYRWTRFYNHDAHWFDPVAADPTAWDHAIVWGNALIPYGDELYIYYSGFQWGHLNRTDRQLGLVKIKRDRLIGRYAGATPTLLRTNLLSLRGQGLSFNVNGHLQVQIVDANNVPLPGFSFAETRVIDGDFIDVPLVSAGAIGALANQNIKLELKLTNGTLFAFSVK